MAKTTTKTNNPITFTATCPECGEDFENEIEEAELLAEPEEPISMQCPECECEFDQKYTYAAGVVTLLPEVSVLIEGNTEDEDEEEDDESEDTDSDDDEDDEDEEDEV